MEPTEITEKQKYVNGLHDQLKTVIAGQSFEKTDAGALIVKILEGDINQFTNQVLSNAFITDHDGYLDARAKANYATSLLARIKRVNDPAKERDIRQQLLDIDNEEKIGAESGK